MEKWKYLAAVSGNFYSAFFGEKSTNVYNSDLERYLTKARISKIRSVADKSPEPGNERKTLDIKLLSFLRVPDLLISEKEKILEAIEKEFLSTY